MEYMKEHEFVGRDDMHWKCKICGGMAPDDIHDVYQKPQMEIPPLRDNYLEDEEKTQPSEIKDVVKLMKEQPIYHVPVPKENTWFDVISILALLFSLIALIGVIILAV